MSNVGVSVGNRLFWIWQILRTAERTKDGLINLKDNEKIESMVGELTNVIEDFDRAVDIEGLRQAKDTGKHSLLQFGGSSLSLASHRAKSVVTVACTCQDRL
jgi:hypothetical protein